MFLFGGVSCGRTKPRPIGYDSVIDNIGLRMDLYEPEKKNTVPPHEAQSHRCSSWETT